MIFNILLSDTARNALNGLSRDIKDKIKEGLEVLMEEPWRRRSNADIKRLRDAPGNWRLRIGDYRAVYTIVNDTKEVRIKKLTHSNKKKKIYKQVGGKL
jgi:mRNA-degrading endonuclease RelE of RelBE toxin-antitoxin system